MVKKRVSRPGDKIKGSVLVPFEPTAPVVGGLDKLEFYINASPVNADILNERFPAVMACLRLGVDGPDGSDFRFRVSVRPKIESLDGPGGPLVQKGTWRIVAENRSSPFAKIAMTGSLKHLGNDLRYGRVQKSARLVYNVCGMGDEVPFELPDQIKGKLAPPSSDTWDTSGIFWWHDRYFGKLVITNPSPRKICYLEYLDCVFDTVSGLERLGMELTPKRLEPYVQTARPRIGAKLLKHAMPARFKPKALYHFDHCQYHGLDFRSCPDHKEHRRRPCALLSGAKCRIPRSGPSLDGLDEYHGHRRRRWGVLHPYSHELKFRHEIGLLYRVEYQLYRRFLRDFMRKNDISSCTDLLHVLLGSLPSLFRFAAFDLERLGRKSTWTRTPSFKQMSTRGQYFALREVGLTPAEVDEFLQPARVPHVSIPGPRWEDIRLGYWNGEPLRGDFSTKTVRPLTSKEAENMSFALWLRPPLSTELTEGEH